VGAPTEGYGDPRKTALYVSKYVGKELAELVAPGKNRYHVTRGHQPVPERHRFPFMGQAEELVYRAAGAAGGVVETFTALHLEVEGWKAPPTWVVSW
jgi:hypothetical protein